MVIFVDTSALYALVSGEDENHARAVSFGESLLRDENVLITTNYVLVETVALTQRRFGLHEVQMLQGSLFPFLDISWIDQDLHEAALNNVLTSSRRHLSFVDFSSFATMRRLGIQQVFTFDKHFAEQGFTCLPEPS